MAEYDSLVIKVSADTKSANKGLTSLKHNLTLLEETTKSLDLTSIKNTQKLLQDIAKIDFSNVSKGLQDVVMAFKALDRMTGKASSGKGNMNAKAIDLMSNNGKGFNEPQWQLPQFDTSKINFENIFGQATPYIERMTDAQGKLSVQLWQVKDAMKSTAKATKELEKNADKASGGFNKLIKAFKRIAFYRVVRRALQMITQSITQAMQSLAKFDDDFNKSISEIKSSFSYLSRALMALIAPIIKLVSPFIAFITTAIGDLANELGGILAGLTGQDTFSGAKENAEDFADSLQKAKNTALGIDELNVLQQDDEEDNWFSQTIDATNDLGGIISELVEEWKPIFESLKNVLIAIKPLLSNLVSLFKQLVGDTSDGVNGSINSLVDLVAVVADLLSAIVDASMPLLKLLNTLNSLLLNQINNVLGAILDIVGALLEPLSSILTPILTYIANALTIVLEPIVLIGELVGLLIKGVLKTIVNALIAVAKVIEAVYNFAKTGEWKTEMFKAVSQAFNDAFDEIGKKFFITIDNFVKAFLHAIDAIGSVFGQDWHLEENYGGGAYTRVYGEETTMTEEEIAQMIDILTNIPNNFFTPTAFGFADPNANGGNSQGEQPVVEVNVSLDGQKIASAIQTRIKNQGKNNFGGGTLTYGKQW